METRTAVYGGIEREYAELSLFAKAHNRVTYEEFDALCLNGLHLFDVPKDDYFRQIEDSLDQIMRALPAIKRIFARPIIRLMDTHEIVPVEMAHIINSQTLSHAALHSELWDDVTADGIKPKKLMTVGRTETYAVYENMVFTRVVDDIFLMLRRTRDLLKDVLYNCRDMHFNLLDRTHHASFFLALGKLYAEYAGAQEFQYASYFRCVEKIGFIERSLRSKLHAPVYTQCKKKSRRVPLKRTNAFRVHKDYKEIWRLAKWLESDPDLKELIAASEDTEMREEYRLFCSLITLFSVGHFGFSFPKEQKFDFENLCATARFKDWRLMVESGRVNDLDLLTFRFEKNIPYTVCLMLGEKKSVSPEELTQIRKAVAADEYLFANAKEYGEEDVVYLSLFNIDSFRRLQQILLRGMTYADTERRECPFCGHALEQNGNLHECPICNAEIREKFCKETGEPYFETGIKQYRFSEELFRKQNEQRRFLHDRYLEASLHFRNITPLAPDGTPICPRCGKGHS